MRWRWSSLHPLYSRIITPCSHFPGWHSLTQCRGIQSESARLRSTFLPETAIFRSPFPDVEIHELSLPQAVLDAAAPHGDTPAYICGTSGRVQTFTEFVTATRQLIKGFRVQGLKMQDVVAVVAPNHVDFASLLHGVLGTGGVISTMNPTWTQIEMHHQLVDSSAKFVVTVPQLLSTVKAACVNTTVERVFCFEDEFHRSLLTHGESPCDPDISPDSPCLLPYSSGTSGPPKGVMLSHRNVWVNALQFMAVQGPDMIPGKSKLMGVLPFFHIYGMQMFLSSNFICGVPTVVMAKFDLEQFLALIQRYSITSLYVAPPIGVALAKHPLVESFDLSSVSLVMSGAAPMGHSIETLIASRLNCKVKQAYGMTELCPVCNVTPTSSIVPGSVGPLVPNTLGKVVDVVTGECVGPGGEGELRVKGPQVMLGYLNNTAASAAAFDSDGWMHTGDVVRVDTWGYMTITDRCKELIKVKGYQVAPAELEAILLSHSAVADCCVIAVPSADDSEAPRAYVVRREGATLSEDDVTQFISDRVSSYKQITGGVEFVDSVPKSPSGKLLRRVLKEQYMGKLSAQRIRRSFVFNLKPGREAAYQQRHDEIWPSMIKMFSENGVHNYNIFFNPDTHQLFTYVETDSQATWNVTSQTEVGLRWRAHMADILETDAVGAPRVTELYHKFYLANPSLSRNPIRKGFMLYLKPGCELEYQKRHDEIWPSMVQMLRDHGVHNYNIFLNRDTNQLFAYCELDSEERWAAVAQTEINLRWRAYMADILETQPDGGPVVLDLNPKFFME